jgi:hypothetical protein
MKKAILILVPSFAFAALIFLLVQSILLKGNDKGALQVTAAPLSKVYLNGKYLGQTPLCKCTNNDMVGIGDYTIKVVPQSGNFGEFQEKITISKSILTVVDRKFGAGAASEGSIITLEPLKEGNQRQLLVTSIPNNVEVLLDNNSAGFTPLLIKDITDSDHKLTLRKSGYTDKEVSIRTPSGYKLVASVYMGVDDEGILSPTPTIKAASPSATPTPIISKVTILQTPTGFLRVRSSNSVASSEVGQVLPGESFDILSEESGWYQIKLVSGKLGWVSSQYAKKE